MTDAAARRHAEAYDWDAIIDGIAAIARDAAGVTT
jgi:hypothetical protein